MRRPAFIASVILAATFGSALVARQRPPVNIPATVRPIQPPDKPLPSEAESAGVTRFSFIAYGDTRSDSGPNGDGVVLHPEHSKLVDLMLARAKALASTPFPVRFVVQSGDAVLRGQNADMWNVSFTPIIDRLTHGANIPYFFSVGNHDVTGMPIGDPGRERGLANALTAVSKLIPAEGSPRRLKGYPTYAFGYGNVFVVAFDSDIASDPLQFAWVQGQIENLDRTRYPHVIAVFHHPLFSSGPHGGSQTIEPQTVALRNLYAPLFRRHHVRLTITGHDHLFDHFVELYDEKGVSHRRDDLVTGGGGAPIYLYSGEPDLEQYLAHGAAQNVRVQHLTKPGTTPAENPHHFVVVQVDGDKLSIEIVGSGPREYKPYSGRARLDLQ
ncbi:MAG: metallophosphoesterase [Acidobacteria bacterium]|nr:metallophosphoesterase [Acidobacteriota bacterium]